MTITAAQAKIAELRFQAAILARESGTLVTNALRSRKDMTKEQEARYEEIGREIDALSEEILAIEADPENTRPRRDVRLLPGARADDRPRRGPRYRGPAL